MNDESMLPVWLGLAGGVAFLLLYISYAVNRRRSPQERRSPFGRYALDVWDFFAIVVALGIFAYVVAQLDIEWKHGKDILLITSLVIFTRRVLLPQSVFEPRYRGLRAASLAFAVLGALGLIYSAVTLPRVLRAWSAADEMTRYRLWHHGSLKVDIAVGAIGAVALTLALLLDRIERRRTRAELAAEDHTEEQ